MTSLMIFSQVDFSYKKHNVLRNFSQELQRTGEWFPQCGHVFGGQPQAAACSPVVVSGDFVVAVQAFGSFAHQSQSYVREDARAVSAKQGFETFRVEAARQPQAGPGHVCAGHAGMLASRSAREA